MRLNSKYFLVLFIFLVNQTLIAQSGNPFEIKNRQSDTTAKVIKENPFELTQPENGESKIEENSKPAITASKPTNKGTKNPFEIYDKGAPNVVENTILEKPSTNKTTQLPENNSTGFLFWVLLSLLLFLTAVISVGRKRLEQIYGSFLNENLLRQTFRQNKGTFSLTYLLLYLLFFLNLGLFIFLSAKEFGYQFPNNFRLLSILWAGTTVAFLIKHLLLYFAGSIFPINKEIKLYSFTIMIFSIILGIILLPINTVLAFAPESIANLTAKVALGAILAIYIFRSLRALSIASRYLVLHKFHFFLYLCAVEIAPVIILLKVILLWMD